VDLNEVLDHETQMDERRLRTRTRLDDLALDEREVVAEFQRHRRGPVSPPERPRLGEILLATGEISQSQLTAVLERKRTSGRRIGDELVAAGLLSADRVRRALGLQRRLMIAALLTALLGPAEAADVRAFMTVSATVVDTVSIRTIYQAESLVITAQDIGRGYVDVPVGSRFEIRNTGASLFEVRPLDPLFRSVKVTGPEGTAEFGSAGGTMLQRSVGHGGSVNVALGYRFELAAGLSPGEHKWPLALTVMPM
jgi:hypothetical protein